MSWIQINPDLSEVPEVIGISSMTGLDRYSVAGRLAKVWGWFDRETIDGNARFVTKSFINDLIGNAGNVTEVTLDRCDFASAMEKVGWLDEKIGVLVMPKFDEHTSESAKARFLNRKRQEKFKAKKRAEKNSNAVTLPNRYSKEEKSTSTHTHDARTHEAEPNAVAPCTIEQAISAASRDGFTEEPARMWFLRCEENFWVNREGTKIGKRNWQPSLHKFCLSHREISQARNKPHSNGSKKDELSPEKKAMIERNRGAFDER